MENANPTAAETPVEALLLRANRKIVETRCNTCNEGFKLTEETYACPVCSGYYHPECWETHHACPGQSGIPEAPPAHANGTQLTEAKVTETQALVDSQTDVAEHERRCPGCKKEVRREALKCRFCGYIFDREYAQTAEEIPRELARQIESYANTSLTTSIIGIFVCGPIFAPMAISNGNDARRLLDQYPSYRSRTSAGGKALAGIIIGWIAIIIFAVGFLSVLGGGGR